MNQENQEAGGVQDSQWWKPGGNPELPNINNGAPLQKQSTAQTRRRAPSQAFDRILNADPTRGVVNVGCGWNISAWNSWSQAGVQASG